MNASAFGQNSRAVNFSATALGAGAFANNNATATGASAFANGFSSTATGTAAVATGSQSTTMGAASTAGGNNNNPSTTAIGAGAQAGASGAFQSNATAIGANALANAANATALGQNAVASGAGGVALGQNSVSNDGNVSVGNATSGLTRTIQNVAAGVNGTDAVNVSQLNTKISGVGVNSFDLPPPLAREDGIPDLGTDEGRSEIDGAILRAEAELVIVDNCSTLIRTGKENEGDSWLSIQSWALTHRRADRSILFVHHDGKGGQQRGTSRREDVLDTVIALRRPENYQAEQGARFEVVFEKSRGFYGDDAQIFEAQYETRDGAAIWTRTEISDAELKRVADTIRDGSTVREAAEELGMSKSKVQRLRQQARDKGLVDD